MPPSKPKQKQEKGIASIDSLYNPEEQAGEKPEAPRYATFKGITRSFSKTFAQYGAGQKFTPEEAEVFAFLDLEISAEEYYAASRGVFIFGMLLGLAAGAIAYISLIGILGMQNTLLVSLMAIMAPLALGLYYKKYPQMAADKEKLLALAYVPEIVNYLVMSLRLNPNLEKAVEFAASHGRGRISDELKKIIWFVQIGKYSSVEEALDDLAYRWGPYSEDFKQSLMTIRASVLEADKARRQEYLEKALADVLEGSKEKMDLYARGLHQPTVFLYYFGIMLPLMLAIVLPIGAAFIKDAEFAKAEYVFVIYCILLPAGVYIYGNSILSGRPPTYVPPSIPENHPGLPGKGLMRVGGVLLPYTAVAILLFCLIASAGFFADYAQESAIPPYDREEALKLIPNVLLFGYSIRVFGIFGVLLGTSVGISVYLYGKYSARKKAQDDIRDMENEFKDALYVLASRLGENRPMEEAMRQALEFLPKSKVATRVFKTVLENITMLGMTVEAAVFDGVYGALKNTPSQTLRSGMRIMVDSMEIGVNVAAKSLISLSMQLRNSHKIDEMLKRLLSDITVLLSTMAIFVAPIVLAVVSSLQTVIINSLSGLGEQQSFSTPSAGSTGMPIDAGGLTTLFGSNNIAKASATPGEFLVIMGVYVIEIVFLLVYFNSQIEDSNNKLHTYTAIAKALPIATVVFCAVAYFTGQTLAGIGG